MKRGIVIMVGVALTTAACGGGDASSTTAAGADVTGVGGAGGIGTEEELEAAAVTSFEAFQAADDQAYFDTFSRECRQELGFAAVESYLDGRRFNIDLGDIDLGELSAGAVTIDGFDGSSARVALDIDGTTEPFRESVPTLWLYEEGAWRIGDCSGIDSSPNDLSAVGADPGRAAELGMVTDLAGWLINQTWVTLDDEEVVVELGGRPAPDGSTLVTTGVSMTYTGPESTVRLSDQLQFALVNGSTAYGDEASCETPDYGTAMVAAEAIGPGDALAPAVVCRIIPESDLEGLLLRVTHAATGGERWFRMDQP